MKDTQLRGHCQCCGRQQAVTSTRMAKHGYTVEDGWFSGVCSGHQHQPMEADISVTASIVKQVRADCQGLRQLADDYSQGSKHPANVSTGRSIRNPDTSRYEDVMIPWAEANTYLRGNAIATAVWQLRHRATSGESFAAQLERLANEVYLKPLIEVARTAGPAPILPGERRQSDGGPVLTCLYVERGRVYWQRERDGKTFKSWTGTQAWRKFQPA